MISPTGVTKGAIAGSFPGGTDGPVSLVVCTLNEAGNVGPVLRRVPNVVEEILVVDGHSEDSTVSEALSVGPHVRVIYQDGRGKGDALRKGLADARGAIIVMIDADGSMDPLEIPRFVAAIGEGADVVKGSRALEGGGSVDLTRFRRLGNWGFCTLANSLHGSRFTDICYGFMAFRREALQFLRPSAPGFDIEAELALQAHDAGLRIAEVPSFERGRLHGRSHLHAFKDGWHILRTVVRGGRPSGWREDAEESREWVAKVHPSRGRPSATRRTGNQAKPPSPPGDYG